MTKSFTRETILNRLARLNGKAPIFTKEGATTMATKKAKKARKKPTLDGGETPITIGGGGGPNPKEILPLTIQFDPNAWTQTKGLLTLIGGNVRRIRVTAGDEVDVRLPVTGDVQILLKCGKPLKPTRP